ncbi:MAG: hypothetical protein KGP29_03305 [Proteobacteria bacterium]|nr:hypothetical protein [Pseudomonadota bacterium]
MKKFFIFFSLLPSLAYAEAPKSFPSITGDVLFQTQADRVISSEKDGVRANNAFIYIEPNISLNFNRNWSAKTQWRLQPNNVLTTRDSSYPERYRTFLQSDRSPLNIGQEALIVEELKAHFENEDMRFVAGKFDPTFGTAWRKSKRIGVFASQFNEDYNLREKLGAGITALLEGSQITFNTFMNDTTGLSNSTINKRGAASNNRGIAGNGGAMSSYSLSMEGKNFIGIENWFYNFGYRNLAVGKVEGRSREVAHVVGSEYLYKITRDTSLIPLMEFVNIKDFGGETGRDARYTTLALIAKYSGWIASASVVTREIKQRQRSGNDVSDHQIQFSIGYKFTNNLTLDLSRANIKENGSKGSLIGTTLSYLYKF